MQSQSDLPLQATRLVIANKAVGVEDEPPPLAGIPLMPGLPVLSQPASELSVASVPHRQLADRGEVAGEALVVDRSAVLEEQDERGERLRDVLEHARVALADRAADARGHGDEQLQRVPA